MENVWEDILCICVEVFVVCLLECGLMMTENMFPSAALCMVKLVAAAHLSVVSGLPTISDIGFHLVFLVDIREVDVGVVECVEVNGVQMVGLVDVE